MHERDYSNIPRRQYWQNKPFVKHLGSLDLLLHLDSFCLGDTLCFSSFLDYFYDYHKPKKLTVTTFWPELFYNTSKYVFEPAVITEGWNDLIVVDKLISVGYRKEDLGDTQIGLVNSAKNHFDIPIDLPLKKPPVKLKSFVKNPKKITIGPESLKKIAQWNYCGNLGWQTIVDYLVSLGYEVHNISFEKTIQLNNVIYHNGHKDINHAIQQLCESQLFIGLSSGLSWLAWAYDIPVVMIAAFTKSYNEFPCYRVRNDYVCNGCFNTFPDIKSHCPLFTDTPRQNECHHRIYPEMVIETIDKALSDISSS